MTDILVPSAYGLLTLLQLASAVVCCALWDHSRARLDEIARKHGRPERFGAILRRGDRVLIAVELARAIVSAGVVAMVAAWLHPWTLEFANGPAVTILVLEALAFAVVFLLAGVVLPWSISRVSGEGVLYHAWPLLELVALVLRPLVSLTMRLDRMVHRLGGLPEPETNGAETLSEEIRTVVEEGQREGVLETEASTMINRVMELHDADASTIMTPRTDMFCIRSDVPLEEARRMLVESGHSRVPVVRENQDDVIGILYAKDLLRHADAETNGAALTDVVREPFYVPETTGIVTLLDTMKRRRVHVAIVVDEYGGVAGLVTMEDVLEEIVGEIVDEYDPAQEVAIRSVAPGITEVDARVHIDELNEQFDYDLPEDGDFDTIGGFVFSELSRIPQAGENFTWRNLRFTVVDADERRIGKLRIEVDESLVATVEEG